MMPVCCLCQNAKSGILCNIAVSSKNNVTIPLHELPEARNILLSTYENNVYLLQIPHQTISSISPCKNAIYNVRVRGKIKCIKHAVLISITSQLQLSGYHSSLRNTILPLHIKSCFTQKCV